MVKTLTPTQLHAIETALEVASAVICTSIKAHERAGDFERASTDRLAQTFIARGRDALDPAPMRSPRAANTGANSVRDALLPDPVEALAIVVDHAEQAA